VDPRRKETRQDYVISYLRKNKDDFGCFFMSASKITDMICAHNYILPKVGETLQAAVQKKPILVCLWSV